MTLLHWTILFSNFNNCEIVKKNKSRILVEVDYVLDINIDLISNNTRSTLLQENAGNETSSANESDDTCLEDVLGVIETADVTEYRKRELNLAEEYYV